jgi:predicted negative regulator of RcsB-dependent stress response
MTRFLGVLVLILAVVIGLGFYLGWFQLSTNKNEQQKNITISVDEQKMKADEEKAKEKAKELSDEAKKKINPP